MNTATSQFKGHTPGEWRLLNDGRIEATSLYDTDDRGGAAPFIVATVRTGLPVANEKTHGCTGANGRLMAAAPVLLRQRDALLEVLRGLLPCSVGVGNLMDHKAHEKAAWEAVKVYDAITAGWKFIKNDSVTSPAKEST